MKRIFLVAALTLLTVGCKITVDVDGPGLVANSDVSVFCGNNGAGVCEKEYSEPGTDVFVAGATNDSSYFAGWGGCPYLTLKTCQVQISQESIDNQDEWTITATFKPKRPTPSTVTYTYNALGQRVTKTVDGVTTVFLYDLDGNLMAEMSAAGQPIREHVHLEGAPIAQISTKDGNATTDYVHTDHLGTPTLLTNQNQKVIVDIESTPFGDTYIDYAQIPYNKRFPGQYKDEESGLHYNYFRDYDPSLGRYIQSDPIGLAGGMNTYQYVTGNPINAIDPLGESGIFIRPFPVSPNIFRPNPTLIRPAPRPIDWHVPVDPNPPPKFPEYDHCMKEYIADTIECEMKCDGSFTGRISEGFCKAKATYRWIQCKNNEPPDEFPEFPDPYEGMPDDSGWWAGTESKIEKNENLQQCADQTLDCQEYGLAEFKATGFRCAS